MTKWIEIPKNSNLHHMVVKLYEKGRLFKHGDTFYKIVDGREHSDNLKRKSHFEIELDPVI